MERISHRYGAAAPAAAGYADRGEGAEDLAVVVAFVVVVAVGCRRRRPRCASG